jgi:putative ABC transport system permease protein
MAFAEPAFLNLFPHQWLAGNPATALQAPFSVVLTASQAQLYFGKSGPRA